MVICLQQHANDLHMILPIISCFLKFKNSLPFQIVMERGLNVAVKWVMLLFHILLVVDGMLEVRGPNLYIIQLYSGQLNSHIVC